MKMRLAKGRLVVTEEISREEVWKRLIQLVGGDSCWMRPYFRIVPINTDHLKANIKLERHGSMGGKYPCELTVWDPANKRFAIKMLPPPNKKELQGFFKEYDFTVNQYMGGKTFIDVQGVQLKV